MSNGSYNIMLDPSMFLSSADNERRLSVMMNRMAALARDGVAMHVPRAFMTFVENSFVDEGGATPDPVWLETYAPPGHQYPDSFERLYWTMTIDGKFLQPFNPTRRLKNEYDEFVKALSAADPANLLVPTPDAPDAEYELSLFGQCILQEWIFLQEKSWIVAETRGAFDLVKKAGAECLELGKRSLDKLVRMTRKKEEEESITTVDQLITLGKWVAAGGGAVAAGGIMLPPALAITVAIAPNFFALLDP
jgi:hypothetical protein